MKMSNKFHLNSLFGSTGMSSYNCISLSTLHSLRWCNTLKNNTPWCLCKFSVMQVISFHQGQLVSWRRFASYPWETSSRNLTGLCTITASNKPECNFHFGQQGSPNTWSFEQILCSRRLLSCTLWEWSIQTVEWNSDI